MLGTVDGHEDVLEGGEIFEQMMELKDEPEMAIPRARKLVLVQAERFEAGDPQRTARGRQQRPGDREERALPLPLGPTSATNAPRSIVTETPRSTCVAVSPSPKVFVMSRASSTLTTGSPRVDRSERRTTPAGRVLSPRRAAKTLISGGLRTR